MPELPPVPLPDAPVFPEELPPPLFPGFAVALVPEDPEPLPVPEDVDFGAAVDWLLGALVASGLAVPEVPDPVPLSPVFPLVPSSVFPSSPDSAVLVRPTSSTWFFSTKT